MVADGPRAERPRPGSTRYSRPWRPHASSCAQLLPAVVLCTAAVSNVELCEREPAAARAVNVDATLALAGAAREAGATFVFLSSEYVFDGEHGPYAEEPPRSPINEYGRQKAEVEEPLPGITGGDYLVARVSCVYAHERRRKNFVYQLQAALSQGCELRVPGDQIGTPTYAPNAADVILGARARRASEACSTSPAPIACCARTSPGSPPRSWDSTPRSSSPRRRRSWGSSPHGRARGPAGRQVRGGREHAADRDPGRDPPDAGGRTARIRTASA